MKIYILSIVNGKQLLELNVIEHSSRGPDNWYKTKNLDEYLIKKNCVVHSQDKPDERDTYCWFVKDLSGILVKKHNQCNTL